MLVASVSYHVKGYLCSCIAWYWCHIEKETTTILVSNLVCLNSCEINFYKCTHIGHFYFFQLLNSEDRKEQSFKTRRTMPWAHNLQCPSTIQWYQCSVNSLITRFDITLTLFLCKLPPDYELTCVLTWDISYK